MKRNYFFRLDRFFLSTYKHPHYYHGEDDAVAWPTRLSSSRFLELPRTGGTLSRRLCTTRSITTRRQILITVLLFRNTTCCTWGRQRAFVSVMPSSSMAAFLSCSIVANRAVHEASSSVVAASSFSHSHLEFHTPRMDSKTPSSLSREGLSSSVPREEFPWRSGTSSSPSDSVTTPVSMRGRRHRPQESNPRRRRARAALYVVLHRLFRKEYPHFLSFPDHHHLLLQGDTQNAARESVGNCSFSSSLFSSSFSGCSLPYLWIASTEGEAIATWVQRTIGAIALLCTTTTQRVPYHHRPSIPHTVLETISTYRKNESEEKISHPETEEKEEERNEEGEVVPSISSSLPLPPREDRLPARNHAETTPGTISLQQQSRAALEEILGRSPPLFSPSLWPSRVMTAGDGALDLERECVHHAEEEEAKRSDMREEMKDALRAVEAKRRSEAARYTTTSPSMDICVIVPPCGTSFVVDGVPSSLRTTSWTTTTTAGIARACDVASFCHVWCLPGSLPAFAAQLRILQLAKRSKETAEFYFSPATSKEWPLLSAGQGQTPSSAPLSSSSSAGLWLSTTEKRQEEEVTAPWTATSTSFSCNTVPPFQAEVVEEAKGCTTPVPPRVSSSTSPAFGTRAQEELWRVLGVESPQSVQIFISEVRDEKGEEIEEEVEEDPIQRTEVEMREATTTTTSSSQSFSFSSSVSLPEPGVRLQDSASRSSTQCEPRSIPIMRRRKKNGWWLPSTREALVIASHMVGGGCRPSRREGGREDPDGNGTCILLFHFHSFSSTMGSNAFPLGGIPREKTMESTTRYGFSSSLHSADLLEALRSQYGVVRPGRSPCGTLHYLFLSGRASSAGARFSTTSSLWWPHYLSAPPREPSPSTTTTSSSPHHHLCSPCSNTLDGATRKRSKTHPRLHHDTRRKTSDTDQRHMKKDETSPERAEEEGRVRRNHGHHSGSTAVASKRRRRITTTTTPSSWKEEERTSWPARKELEEDPLLSSSSSSAFYLDPPPPAPWKALFQRRAAFHRAQQGRHGFPKHFRPMLPTRSGTFSTPPGTTSSSTASRIGGVSIPSSSSSTSMLFVSRLVPHFMTARYLPEDMESEGEPGEDTTQARESHDDEEAMNFKRTDLMTRDAGKIVPASDSTSSSSRRGGAAPHFCPTAAKAYRHAVASAATEREAKWEEEEAAFLGVSIDMVTKRAFSRNRDD